LGDCPNGQYGAQACVTFTNGERQRVVRVDLKIVIAIAVGFLVGALSAISMRVAQTGNTAITSGTLRETGQAEIGGPFHLVDQNGRDFTHEQLLGKPSLVVFGYTASPDLTPATLNVVSQALNGLGARADSVRVVFISLDWERDRPHVLKAYLDRFHPSIIGLTGSEDEIRNVAGAYKIFLERRISADGSVEIDHSQLMFALNDSGAYVAHLRLPTNVKAVSALLRRLLS
jgi:protein SCO1/2